MNKDPVFPETPYAAGITIDHDTGTDTQVIAFGDTAALLVRQIFVANQSASAYLLCISLEIGGIAYQVAKVSIPANSGNANGTLPVQLIDPAKIPGIQYDPNSNLILPASAKILLNSTTTLTAGHVLKCSCLGGTY